MWQTAGVAALPPIMVVDLARLLSKTLRKKTAEKQSANAGLPFSVKTLCFAW